MNLQAKNFIRDLDSKEKIEQKISSQQKWLVKVCEH